MVDFSEREKKKYLALCTVDCLEAPLEVQI